MKRFGKNVKWLILIAVFVAALPLYMRHQDIVDWYRLRNYTPISHIVSIAERTTMTGLGKKYYYLFDPRLMDKTEFNTYCHVREATIVLGCYTGQGIYIYNIEEPKLDGVLEVTSAHEMLHAAYDRLSSSERKRIDALLQKEIQKVDNPRVKEVSNSYRLADASTYVNELHSIIGTEVRNIDPELELYYSRYFFNRAAIVDLSEKYEQVFTDIKQQVQNYDADLSLRKAEITNLQTSQQSEEQRLTAWRLQLDQLQQSGKTAEYNQQVGVYNQAVNDYNDTIRRLKTLIEEYNSLVIKRNSLAIEQNSLVKSIDSRPEEL